MAETTEFVSRISVKDLISAFENKSETVRVEFTRPRARSYGNVLSKNVVVRINEFTTLDDIEKALTKLQIDLNFYEVYNKAKHVAFQEQSFNILTSILNIENDEEDAPIRKKSLISRTQTLVSFLNQKLPTNINQVVGTNSNTQYKYTPYSSYIKETPKVEPKAEPVETKTNNEPDTKPELYVESGAHVNITESGEEYIVSVKKLKETFLQKSEVQSKESIKQEKSSKTTEKVTRTGSTTTVKNVETKIKKAQPELKKEDETPIKEDTVKTEEKIEAVSVTKLRSLFEQRSEENSKGLEIITVDKPQLTKTPLVKSMQNINIPYTDWNLGSYRLQRSVSGNYMNYSGLLKRVDIHKSNSVLELNKSNDKSPIEDISDEELSTKSDESVERRKSPVKIEAVEENGSSPTVDDQRPTPKKFAKKPVFVTKNAEEVQIKYSSSIATEEENNNVIVLKNVPNGTAALAPEDQPQQNDKNLEEVANLQGFKEEEVSYSKARTEDISQDENTISEKELSFKGVSEVDVNVGTADSRKVEVEESVATLQAGEEDIPQFTSTVENPKVASKDELQQNDKNLVSNLQGFEEEEVSYSKARTEDISQDENTISEKELSFKGVSEVDVNVGTADSKKVEVEESVATLQAGEEDTPQFTSTVAFTENPKVASEDQPQQNDKNLEVSNLQGFEEEEVSYSKASTEDIRQDENTISEKELSFKGVAEVDVNVGTADSKKVEVEESVATLQAGEEDIPQFTSTIAFTENSKVAENNTDFEKELSFNGLDEVEVNSKTAEIKNVQVEEHIAKLEATAEDVSHPVDSSGIRSQVIENTKEVDNSQHNSLQGTENHVTENTKEPFSSQFNSLDLEDERDRSIIEEVIEQIDVEKTLANADLVVNPEDLKNADDEFEKLIENAETKK